MEFFHAKIYWSGFAEVITNVDVIPNPYTGELNEKDGEYAILFIRLNKNEVQALKDYLQKELDKSISDSEFENSMCVTFYVGSPVDCWFNLEKFMQVCKKLKIKPTMDFYSYRHMQRVNA